jgi:predicted nucleic acid-binding protein
VSPAGGAARPPIRVVLADANVLYSRVLRDYLLYATAQGALEIRWSAQILDEMVEHLMKNIPSFDASAGARLTAAMNRAFPAAEVSTDSAARKTVATARLSDEDDRHVLASAVAAAVDVLCTNNLRDFPADTVNELRIRLMSADDLLSLLITDFPEELTAAHLLSVSRLPGATDDSTLAALRSAGAVKASERMSALLRRTRPSR